MDRGWVKHWRKELDSRVFRSSIPDVQKVWDWCKLRAAHKRVWVSKRAAGRGSVDFELEPGQFICGRDSAAQELPGLTPEQIRYRLTKLAEWGNITIKRTSFGSVISVNNWRIYQDRDSADSQQNSQPCPSRVPAVSQPCPSGVPPNKNEENEKNTRALDFDRLVLPAGFDTPDVRQACQAWLDHLDQLGRDDPTYTPPIDAEQAMCDLLRCFQAADQFCRAVYFARANRYRTVHAGMAGKADGGTAGGRPESEGGPSRRLHG